MQTNEWNELDIDIEYQSDELVTLKDSIKQDMCSICNEYHISENDKCSYCAQGISKCIKCKTYYSPIEKLHCSECEQLLTYDGVGLTMDQLINLPTSAFKGISMSERLEEVFEYYKTKNNLKHKLIKNINEFKILQNLCKNASSGEIYCILNGQRDYHICVLPAKYADQLLDQCMETCTSENQYKYIHAIAPFIFDVWNLPSKHAVLDCYYREFGNFTKCPNSSEKLFETWGRCIRAYQAYNLDNVKLKDCNTCKNSLYLVNKKIRCKSCLEYIHAECIYILPKCSSCNIYWIKDNIIIE